MTAANAAKFMHDCNIQYLPVVEDEQLVGIVEESKTRGAAFNLGLPTLVVNDIMDSKPYCIYEDASLARVIQAMLQSKHLYILAVSDDEKVVGIFTATNALHILLELLEGQESSSSLRVHYDRFPSSLNWRISG